MLEVLFRHMEKNVTRKPLPGEPPLHSSKTMTVRAYPYCSVLTAAALLVLRVVVCADGPVHLCVRIQISVTHTNM